MPIYNKEIKLKNAVKVYPHSRRSLERWLEAYKQGGEAAHFAPPPNPSPPQAGEDRIRFELFLKYTADKRRRGGAERSLRSVGDEVLRSKDRM